MKAKLLLLVIGIFFVVSQARAVNLSYNINCVTQKVEFTGQSQYTGSNFLWMLYRGSEVVYSVSNSSSTFFKTFNMSNFVSGNYKLKVHYKPTGSPVYYVDETSSIIPASCEPIDPLTVSTLGYTLLENQINNRCFKSDSVVMRSNWLFYNAQIYTTTGFGQSPGTELNLATYGYLDNDEFFLSKYTVTGTPDYYVTSAFDQSAYLVIDITFKYEHVCAPSITKRYYFYRDPNPCTSPRIAANNILESNTISVYPNPTESSINLSGDVSEVSKIELVSSQGQLVISLGEPTSSEIDLSGISAGLYTAKVYKKDGSILFSKVTKK